MTQSDAPRSGKAGTQKQDVWSAGMALSRSLFRLGLTVATAPARMLPEETRQHLKAAGREAVQAGEALKREMLASSDDDLAEARRQLDELEKELDEIEQQAN